jgi:hypothetical protein
MTITDTEAAKAHQTAPARQSGPGRLLCTAVYDSPANTGSKDTHTCGITDGHEGAHFCDICNLWWFTKVAETPEEAIGGKPVRGRNAEQVEAARADARRDGTGFVMIDQDDEGRLSYRRVDPSKVTIRA